MKMQQEGNKELFLIDTRCYDQAVIFKVAYMYIDAYYLSLEYIDQFMIQVSMEPKDNSVLDLLEETAKTFANDLLAQKVRYDVANETKNIRELILGRALYSTCLETEEAACEEEEEEEMPLDRIAINWFVSQEGEN